MDAKTKELINALTKTSIVVHPGRCSRAMADAASLIEQQEREIEQLKSARTLLMDELEEVRKVLGRT